MADPGVPGPARAGGRQAGDPAVVLSAAPESAPGRDLPPAVGGPGPGAPRAPAGRRSGAAPGAAPGAGTGPALPGEHG